MFNQERVRGVSSHISWEARLESWGKGYAVEVYSLVTSAERVPSEQRDIWQNHFEGEAGDRSSGELGRWASSSLTGGWKGRDKVLSPVNKDEVASAEKQDYSSMWSIGEADACGF